MVHSDDVDEAVKTGYKAWNSKGVYTYCSEKVQEVLGYSVNEIIGKTPFDLMLQEEAEKIAQIFKELLEKKKPIKDLEITKAVDCRD